MREILVPTWEKANLTLEEASAYFGIGVNKLRDLTNGEDCQEVLWCGSKRLIKRKNGSPFREIILYINLELDKEDGEIL